MKHRFLLLYVWFIRIILFFFPDVPFIMRFRGWLYSLGMKYAGKNFQVAHNVILNSIEYMSVGDNVYIAMSNIFLAHGGITIGNNVMFGPGCLVAAGNHTLKDGAYRYGPTVNAPIKIGNGSWIGGHCVLLLGLDFPEKSIAGAGSLLSNKLINMGEGLYAGCPAKYIKFNK